MKEFKEKVALVTGAASGIGFALADRFASVGMKVVLCDIEEGALAQAEQSLRAKGAPVLAFRCDVSKADDVETLANRAYEKFGAVHVLCNNAGVGAGGLSWRHSLEDWQWVLGVNLWGVIHGIRTFVPRMLDQGTEGHIVNTASVAGLVAGAGIGPYNASKSAVVAISETLRKELDLSEAGVGVSVLCPGYVRTNIFESQRNRPEALRNPSRAAGDARVRNDALKRMLDIAMDPAEVAGMVHDAVIEDRFWVITHAEFLKPIAERADEIVAGTNPRPGRFGE